MACAGNSGETCGGNRRLDVYQSSSGWASLGCYTDNASTRTLSHYITVPGGQGATTIEACQSACFALGYSYAGIEYANECCEFLLLPLIISQRLTNLIVCDNSIRNGGPAPDGNTQCNMACAGDNTEICGGNLRVDVYQYTSISTAGWASLGCYTDSTSARALGHYITVPEGVGATTIESCQAACLSLGYSISGVEYANECCKFSFSTTYCF
jgi:glucan endo-1,3-alpha-glucosidase